MGANIKLVRRHNAMHEDEVSRISTNFFKTRDIAPTKFFSADHSSYLTGGGVAAHSHEDLEEVFYFIRGTGTFELDGVEIPIKAGSVVVVPPKSLHAIRNTGNDILQNIVCSTKLPKEAD